MKNEDRWWKVMSRPLLAVDYNCDDGFIVVKAQTADGAVFCVTGDLEIDQRKNDLGEYLTQSTAYKVIPY